MVTKNSRMKIKINVDGPYTVYGGVPLMEQTLVPDAQGLSTRWHKGREYPLQEEYDLCRCGQSRNKPFCDLSHSEIFIDGTETASREPFASAHPMTLKQKKLPSRKWAIVPPDGWFCTIKPGT